MTAVTVHSDFGAQEIKSVTTYLSSGPQILSITYGLALFQALGTQQSGGKQNSYSSKAYILEEKEDHK